MKRPDIADVIGALTYSRALLKAERDRVKRTHTSPHGVDRDAQDWIDEYDLALQRCDRALTIMRGEATHG